MPFCTSCGAEVPADKKFCVHCGNPMEPVTAPVAPVITPGTAGPANPPFAVGVPPQQPKKPQTALIIGGIIVVLVILAAAYVVGLPMLTANQKSAAPTLIPTPSVQYTMIPTTIPTPEMTIPETTIIPATPTPPIQVKDARFEESYEQIYTLNQKFSFGQKVNFDHDLTRPPLYIKFNVSPTQIVRHRLVSAMTNNEHYENTTESSPNAWFEIQVLDAASGAVINQQGFAKDYPDVTSQSFMVRQRGNYRIEMSGHEVTADVQMLIGTV